MSRVLIVVGSRREGCSLTLADKIKKSLKEQRIISKIIVPGNQKIYLCTGCMDCDENGVCDFHDDMEENINKVLKSDTVIFITPTRWNLLSGDIKIFMDRLNPLWTSQKLRDKKAIAIAVGNSDKEDYSVNAALTSLDSFCERSGMKLLRKYAFYNCLNKEDLDNQEENINKMIQELKSLLKI